MLPSAVPALVNASRRCWPAPLSTVVAVALPTRIATTKIRIWATRMLSRNLTPTQARISGSASRKSAEASGTTLTSESWVPRTKMRRSRSGFLPASLSTITGKRTPFNWLVSRCSISARRCGTVHSATAALEI